MADGTSIAYDLYLPDGTAPRGGWPGVVAPARPRRLEGRHGADRARSFVSHGYAALAYSARGAGTSTGNLELAGPNEISDERALESFFAGLPRGQRHADRRLGRLLRRRPGLERPRRRDPVQGGRGRRDLDRPLQRALAAGHRALGDRRAASRKAVAARSPLIAANETDAIQSLDMPAIKALDDPRSAYRAAAFDHDAGLHVPGSRRLGVRRHAGRERLHAHQGAEASLHRPVRASAVDVPRPRLRATCSAQGARVVRPLPEGRAERHRQVEAGDDRRRDRDEARLVRRHPEDEGRRRRLPRHGAARAPARSSSSRSRRSASRCSRCRCEGVELPAPRRGRARRQPRDHARRDRPEGRACRRSGSRTTCSTSRRGRGCRVVFGPVVGGADLAYLGFGDSGTISLGSAFLSLQVLTKPVSG